MTQYNLYIERDMMKSAINKGKEDQWSWEDSMANQKMGLQNSETKNHQLNKIRTC